MADSKITALTAITTVNPATYPLVIVDTSDTSMAITGTTKKVTTNQLLGSGGTATLASATITGDLTVDTSTLKVDSANNRVGIGTASPSYILDILGASPRLHIRDNGTGSSLLDIENGAGTFYVGRENSTGSGGLSGVPYAGILYLQGAYPIICGTNFTERYRIASDGVATWSNVGGVAGTAMTLNATGLGLGVGPSYPFHLRNSASAIAMVHSTNANGPYVIFQNSTANFGDIGSELAITGGGSAGNLTLNSRSTSNLCFAVSDSVKMRIDSSGNVGIGVTPAGTGGCLQLKSGITFPATQVASSDANTLDDYEEGTWTATLKGSVSDPTTPVTVTGRYTKIGRQVYVQVLFGNVNTTGASGNVSIEGLPFANNASIASEGTILSDQTLTFTGSPIALIDVSASKMLIYQSSSNASATYCTHNAGTGRYLYANVTYTVA